MIHNVARSWLVSLALAACAAVATGVVAALFALWRFLSESGPARCFVDHNPDGSLCLYQHSGWGYGPTTLWFVLIVWTVTALVIVVRGKGE